jgi:energy-coupling factor transporter ATP-binding protein EcfA2
MLVGMAKKKPGRKQSEAAYKRHRQAAAKRARMESAGDREIGPVPAIENPKRRSECEQDLQLALESYFPDVFALGWSHQHIEVIDCLNATLREGGLFAIGMPRGSGKTSLCVHAAILAMLFGWRRFLVLIGATQEAAQEMLDVFKVQIETNDLLLADFPEICYPIRQLEGIINRSKGQTIDGEPTNIKWSGRKVAVLPTVAGAAGSGGIIRAAGLLGRIRGMLHMRTDGAIDRPDAFLGDDLQTDQSAKNVAQVERRETLLNGAVLGLAGPGKRIAGLATVTIVRKGDLADRLLDRRVNPRWQGKTFSLVEQWPEPAALEHWEQYAELREQDLQNGNPLLPKATKYYRSNRAAMDIGAIVPWAQRREPHELSALQNAYNLKLANPASFDAEYQNNPQLSNTAIGLVACPDSDSIVQRVNGYSRGTIPRDATHLFCGIDVQQDVLFYLIMAMNEDFTGWAIDYGAYPEQPLGNYWTLSDAQVSLRAATGEPDIESAWFKGANKLITTIAAKQYLREDGAIMPLDRIVIDANYGPSTDTIYAVCRQSGLGVLPFHGKGITAKQQPLNARKKKTGERAGAEWFMPATKGTHTPRHVIADVNLIKTNLAQRLTIPVTARGAWTLFQHSIAGHRMLADHWSAEYPIETEGRGRKLFEWSLRPGRDNHWFDCAVMIATAALMDGCVPGAARRATAAKEPTKSLAQLRAEAMSKRKKG